MTPELLVVLLEQHLSDIRGGLVGPAWGDFVAGLERHSAVLEATRRSLEEWTDRVVELMGGFDYTKGILKGLSIISEPATRGVPRWQPTDHGSPARVPEVRTPTEEELVARVEGVVRMARSVA